MARAPKRPKKAKSQPKPSRAKARPVVAADPVTHAALKNLTAVLSATKPHKPRDAITVDVTDCVSAWLVRKGISKPDSMNTSKKMSGDLHLADEGEMLRCLTSVQTCLATKGDFYHPDTTSPDAGPHLTKLLNGTLGDVIVDIVSHTS